MDFLEIAEYVGIAVVVGVGLLGFTYCALRHALVTASILAAVWIATIALRDALDLSATFAVAGSDFRVFVADVLYSVILAVALVRSVRLPPPYDAPGRLARWSVFLLVALLGVHIGRGIVEFDLETAVDGSRDWLYFVGALAYAATTRWGPGGGVWKVLAATGALLAIIALPYFATEGLSAASEAVSRNGQLISTRAIIASGTLVILEAAVIAVAIRWPSDRLAPALALGCVAVSILLQHRTVWVVAVVVGTASLVLWALNQTRYRRATVVAASVGIVLATAGVSALALTQSASLRASLEEATSRHATVSWRVEGWEKMLVKNYSASDIAIGNTSGGNYARRYLPGPQGRQYPTKVSPHNEFIDSYLRLGVLGLLSFCCLGVVTWLSRSSAGPETGLPGWAVILLLLCVYVYSLTWSLDSVQGLVLGALAAGLVTRRSHGEPIDHGSPPRNHPNHRAARKP